MFLGGLQKNTLLDYPGKVATTVFTIGCNFRCPFCYSSELVLPSKIKKQPLLSEDYFFSFLKQRVGKIDGIVICGGEPTIQKDLIEFIKKIKNLGFLVKLDTNGYLTHILKRILKENILDYVAMDIKAPKNKYQKYSGKKIDISKIESSINILKSYGGKVDYEFRTTVAPGISKEDIIKIANWIGPAKSYFLQEFLGTKDIINPKIKNLSTLTKDDIETVIKEISANFEICKSR